MKKKLIGIICLLYAEMIAYMWVTNQLKNFLAPNLQLYIECSVLPLFLIGLILCLKEDLPYQFRRSDWILILPLLMVLFVGDGRLTSTLAKNRMSSHETKTVVEEIKEPLEEKTEEVEIETISFEKVDFDVIDETYTFLSSYLTYEPKAKSQTGKTIRVRGFITKDGGYIPTGYIGIGKFEISCCAADAGFVGFLVSDKINVKEDTWYEIEGILEPVKSEYQAIIMGINPIHVQKIDSKTEEPYVYPCYNYGDGNCKETQKYNFEY